MDLGRPAVPNVTGRESHERRGRPLKEGPGS